MKSKVEVACEKYMNILEKNIYSVKWEERDSFADWLAQTYYYVRHSTRVLALAGVRFLDDQHMHHKQMIHHADHELGHEKIAIHDLKQLGYNLNDISEKPETRRIYQSIYYQLQYESPICIYGYVYFLEMLSLKFGTHVRKQADEFYRQMGKKESYLKVHTENDDDHISEYIDIIRNFNQTDEEHVLRALEQTFSNYSSMIIALATDNNSVNAA